VLGAVPVACWTDLRYSCLFLVAVRPRLRPAVAFMLWAGDAVTCWVGECRGCWLAWRWHSVMPLGKCQCCTLHMLLLLYLARIAIVAVRVTVAAWVVSCTMWVMSCLFICWYVPCVRERFPHQRRDLSHCWQFCSVSAFAVGGRAVSGRADSRAPAGACGLLVVSHRWGPAAPLAISHRWGPAAPLAVSQVRCRRSMGSVIARVKVALRAQLDRQGKY
jgi:hypothetical protein